MEKLKAVILKPGKEKALKGKHPWIFSGAIAKKPNFEAGELLQVLSHSGDLLGTGYFHPKNSLAGRMISFGSEEPYAAILRAIQNSISLRKALFDERTTAYRLINAEGDNLPGLIVDRYSDVLVLQMATVGMERLKGFIVQELLKALNPKAIYEKSTASARKEEGLRPHQEVLFGALPDEITILENGLKFIVNVKEGQKTGFFLDQREMRQYVKEIAGGKKVLNAFSYTGGFSVYALAGGAKHVDSLDISKEAVELANKNCHLNGFKKDQFNEISADVFQYLRENELDYELVILDPPAFAKKASDVIQACRGYKDINRLAMQKMPKNSILVTCSCSHFVDEGLFQKVVFQAALEAGRNVRILSRHRQAPDHPVSIFHPEGEYLKSLVLWVE